MRERQRRAVGSNALLGRRVARVDFRDTRLTIRFGGREIVPAGQLDSSRRSAVRIRSSRFPCSRAMASRCFRTSSTMGSRRLVMTQAPSVPLAYTDRSIRKVPQVPRPEIVGAVDRGNGDMDRISTRTGRQCAGPQEDSDERADLRARRQQRNAAQRREPTSCLCSIASSRFCHNRRRHEDFEPPSSRPPVSSDALMRGPDPCWDRPRDSSRWSFQCGHSASSGVPKSTRISATVD